MRPIDLVRRPSGRIVALALGALAAVAQVLALTAAVPAQAHWAGPTPIGAPDRQWWNSLHASDGGVPCCDIADGRKVEDVDWDTQRDAAGALHYRVRLGGQ